MTHKYANLYTPSSDGISLHNLPTHTHVSAYLWYWFQIASTFTPSVDFYAIDLFCRCFALYVFILFLHNNKVLIFIAMYLGAFARLHDKQVHCFPTYLHNIVMYFVGLDMELFIVVIYMVFLNRTASVVNYLVHNKIHFNFQYLPNVLCHVFRCQWSPSSLHSILIFPPIARVCYVERVGKNGGGGVQG